MGFGWLLLGYFVSTLMTLNQAGSLIRLVGWGIVLASSIKLRRYHSAFGAMGICACLLILVSGALAFADVTGYLYDNLVLLERPVSESFREGIGYGEQIASLLFQTSMLFAIRAIARETEVKKISDNAIRNFVFVCMYFLAYAVSLSLASRGGRLAVTVAGVVWILYFACILLHLLLIFSCYRMICDEDDVEMAQKPSRFAFVNRFREKNEQKSQKAMAEYEAYRLEKRERREQKKKRRGK